MAFDPATGQLVAFDDRSNCTDSPTFTWDGGAWANHQQAGQPPPLDNPALGYDAATKQVVMFGSLITGTCGDGDFNGFDAETWVWNGSIWAQQNPATAPAPSEFGCSAYDSASSQFVMYGGTDGGADNGLDLTWQWTGSNWTQLSPAASPPGGPCSMTYDPVRKTLVMLVLDWNARASTTAPVAQTWTWNGSTWSHVTDLPTPGPMGAGIFPIAFDAATGTDLSYVGQTTCPPDTSADVSPDIDCTQTDQTWAFDGMSWTQLPAANNPEPGAFYTGAYDAATHQFVLIGGVIDFTKGENAATLVYAAPTSSKVTPTRISGADRDATAVAVSKTAFAATGSASAVVLARSDVFADALAGGPLAAAKKAPLLLTSSGSLDAETKAEIQRVLPSGGTVYLLGGTAALSPAVESAISALGDVPSRLAGTDRSGTAVAIADAMGDPSTVFEASGSDFPDALSAVPAAVTQHGAILLTNGSAQASATSTYLAAHATTRYAVGGPAAWADPSAIALAGADRYATSEAVALAFFPEVASISVASAVSFPDALAGGPVAGMAGQAMLLVPPTGALPAAVKTYLSTHTLTSANAFGGTSAIANSVLAAI
jgi:hypothetical protein